MITSLPIRYRHKELSSFGLSPADAAEQVREAMYGEVVDTVNQGTKQFDLVVRLDPSQRETIEQVKDLLLRGRNGAIVRLRDVADIGPERSSNLITRENAQRKAVVSLNVADGSNLGDLIAEVQTEGGNVFENTAALFGFGGSYIAPVISIASMVGFITLFGISIRNGILLINHYEHLMKVEGLNVTEAIKQGSMERLVPILMTALSAVLGLAPLALAAGKPGSELLAPLAIVTLGGLLTSTILNLIVIPAGFSLVFGNTTRTQL